MGTSYVLFLYRLHPSYEDMCWYIGYIDWCELSVVLCFDCWIVCQALGEVCNGNEIFGGTFLPTSASLPQLRSSTFSIPPSLPLFPSSNIRRWTQADFQLGAIRYERDVRSIANYLSTQTTFGGARDKFTRLQQISTVLNLDAVSPVHLLSSLLISTPVLSDLSQQDDP